MGLLMYQDMEKTSVQKRTLLSLEEFEALNTSTLSEFLKNKYKHQQEIFPFFEILKQQMINGKAFMLLTKQRLQCSPYEFPDGLIVLIEDEIKKLRSPEGTDVGSIETSMEKMDITEKIAHSRLNDIELLRRLFRGIAEANNLTYKGISDEIKSSNHSISESTISNFYNGNSDLSSGNKIAVQKWVGKFIDEWKKDGHSLTILVKLDSAHST